MEFSKRVTRFPRSFDEERGLNAAQKLRLQHEPMLSLVSGAAGSSAHLSHLIEKESEWLNELVERNPSESFEQLFEPSGKNNIDDLKADLRRRKRQASLIIGLADLGGVWTLSETTMALSRFADFAVRTALRTVLRSEFLAGRLGPCQETDLQTSCGISVIGMGKLGALELNYSSDIDLIILFDETRFKPDDYAKVRKAFVRVTQQVVSILSEHTADGYVFRTDLRLRPNPSVTPICMAMEPAEHYYESVGRTWERAAMIKARPIAGDIAAGEAFLSRLSPFIWRKYLDFTAIKNAQDMLLNIRDHKKLHDVDKFEGRDVKLDRGGIREIEFFAQTQQLIFGGREESLRSTGTLETLRNLAALDLINNDTANVLSESYVWLRELEHRIQMLDDRQNHQIPNSEAGVAQLACLFGLADEEELKTKLFEVTKLVHENTSLSLAVSSDAPKSKSINETDRTLKEFEKRWFEFPALRNERSRELYEEVRENLISLISELPDQDEVLSRFERFLSGLPAGVQLFSLFSARPQLLELVLDVCAISPQLAEFLGRQAGVLDAVLDRNFFEKFADIDTLTGQIEEILSELDDYEDKLNALRRWQKELHFRNGVHFLRHISTPEEVSLVYSNIAEASIAALLPHVQSHLEEKYGPSPGKGLCVLAMGKLGSREMTASSDLDLIVIYDGEGVQETSGPRQIATATYFARLTQALVSGLTAQTSEGNLYEVDLRLRPSGRKGPVATSLNSFSEYQLNEAWTWEHLALVRSRIVAGSKELKTSVQTVIDNVLRLQRDAPKILKDVSDMRERLAQSLGNKEHSNWEAKRGGGRMLDIELMLQTGAVLHEITSAKSAKDLVPILEDLNWFDYETAGTIAQTHKLLSGMQQIQRLVGPSFEPDPEDTRTSSFVCKSLNVESIERLKTSINELVGKSHRIVTSKLTT